MKRVRSTFLALALCALVGPALAASLPADSTDVPAIGPFHLGMSAAEIRAASPAIAWTVKPPGYSGAFELATGDYPIAGLMFSASLYGNAEVGLVGMVFAREATAPTWGACEDQAFDLVRAVEATTGPFGPYFQTSEEQELETNVPVGNSELRTGALASGSPSDVMRPDRARRGRPDHAWVRGWRMFDTSIGPREILISADYWGNEGATCQLSIELSDRTRAD